MRGAWITVERVYSLDGGPVASSTPDRWVTAFGEYRADRADDDGLYSLRVDPNEDVSPEGSAYRIRRKSKDRQTETDVVVEVPVPPAELVLSAPVTLPAPTIEIVGSTSAFESPTGGGLGFLLVDGDQIVSYTAHTGTTFTGCAGGSGLVDAGASVEQAYWVPNLQVDPPVGLPTWLSDLLAQEIADRLAGDALLIPLAQKAAPNGVATLDALGKLLTSQLPALPPVATGDTFTAASQAAMLALVATRGDMAVRTDLDPDGLFVLLADDPTVLANWLQITTPASVLSVNGRIGAVTDLVDDDELVRTVDGLTPILRTLDEARKLQGHTVVRATRTAYQQDIINTGTTRWASAVVAAGKVFCIPRDATKVLIFDPAEGTFIQTDFGLTLTDLAKWNGAAVGPDGRIYCAPENATDVLVIDPIGMTAERTTFGLTLTGSTKWIGAATGADGRIYCCPWSAADILVIDPRSRSATRLTYGLSGLSTATKWGAMVAVGPKVYGIPVSATDILVIDVFAQTASRTAMGATLTGSVKWNGAAAVAGTIYGIPRDATDILVIDTAAGTATRSAMGATLTGTDKWRSAVAVGGKVIAVPTTATDLLVIDHVAGTATRTSMGAYNIRTPGSPGIAAGAKWYACVAVGSKVYGVPGGTTAPGQDFLFVDMDTSTAYHGDGRIRVDGATKWFGGVLAPDDNIYCAPASTADFLIIDSRTHVARRKTYGLTFPDPSAPQKYASGVLAPDGKLYFIPRSAATDVLVLDPVAQTVTAKTWGLDLGDGVVEEQKWIGSCVGLDGKIYTCPYNHNKVLVINPDTDTAVLTDFGLDLGTFTPNGASKWVGMALHPNGKIYCGPRGVNDVLVIDTLAYTAERTDFGLDMSGVGVKWSMPKLGVDGCIYMLPRTQPSIIRIDPAAGTAAKLTYGLSFTGYGGSIASTTGPDGRIYALPVDAGQILVLDPLTQTASWQSFGANMAASPANNKWAGAVQGADGSIFGIPRTAEGIILEFPGAVPLPSTALLSPYLNKL